MATVTALTRFMFVASTRMLGCRIAVWGVSSTGPISDESNPQSLRFKAQLRLGRANHTGNT